LWKRRDSRGDATDILIAAGSYAENLVAVPLLAQEIIHLAELLKTRTWVLFAATGLIKTMNSMLICL
jgi:hypothetical protein